MLHKMYHIMSHLIIGRLSHCLENGALYDHAIGDSIDRRIQRDLNEKEKGAMQPARLHRRFCGDVIYPRLPRD